MTDHENWEIAGRRPDDTGLPEGNDPLLDRLYDELKSLARSWLSREAGGHSLQPTELVNEALLKLMRSEALDELTQGRMLGFAARAMRQILTDHARRVAAQKRGGGWMRVTLKGIAQDDEDQSVALLVLDEALRALESKDPRLALMTEWHYFGEMTHPQIAGLLETSASTVKRELSLARALLLREMDRIQSDRP